MQQNGQFSISRHLPFSALCHDNTEHNRANVFPDPVGLSRRQFWCFWHPRMTCGNRFCLGMTNDVIVNSTSNKSFFTLSIMDTWDGYGLTGISILTPPIVYVYDGRSTGGLLGVADARENRPDIADVSLSAVD